MIPSAIIDALVAAGATAEMLAAAHRADQAIEEERAAARRLKAAQRQRRHRATVASRDVTVTERDRHALSRDVTQRARDADAAPPNVPPHPPKYTPQGSAPSERPTRVGAGLAQAEPMGFERAGPFGEDPKATLFREGKLTLVTFGVAERRTGALIGRWLKANPDPVGLLAAIQYARDQNVAEPVAYISTLLNGKSHVARPHTLASAADDLITRAENFERENGPVIDHDAC